MAAADINAKIGIPQQCIYQMCGHCDKFRFLGDTLMTKQLAGYHQKLVKDSRPEDWHIMFNVLTDTPGC